VNIRDVESWFGPWRADGEPIYKCSCGANDWRICNQQWEQETGKIAFWQHPGLLDPARHWIRENLPKRFVAIDDDQIVAYHRGGDLGYQRVISYKAFGKEQGVKERCTCERILTPGRTRCFLVTFIGGNCPGPLAHYPEPVNGLPIPKAPATEIHVQEVLINGSPGREKLMDEAGYKQWLMNEWGAKRA